MTFERACALADVPTDEALGGHRRRATTSPSPATATRSSRSQDLCSHAAVALSEGEVADCTIECWLHGSRFDLRTGKPTGLPATEPVATFPVDVRDVDGTTSTSTSSTTLNGVTPA